MRFSEASALHEVDKSLDGVVEGWVTVEHPRAQGGPSSTTTLSGARDSSPPPRWRSASSLWVSHLISAKLPQLISFVICSGATLWATFIGGIIMFK
jgi:hypothetical protein